MGRLGWPLDAVGQRLIKDSVVVNLAGFREGNSQLGQDLRSIDVVARLGGDEFGIILPEIPPQGVLTVAQRLRQKVSGALENVNGLAKKGQKITLSIGVATFPEQADSAEELVKQADNSLYRAKTSGRDQVGPFLPNPHPK